MARTSEDNSVNLPLREGGIRRFLATVGMLLSVLLGMALPGDAAAQSGLFLLPQQNRDYYGVDLPWQARARMGTVRWRHGDEVTAALFLPKEDSIVSASLDGTIRLWDFATGKEKRRFIGHAGRIQSLALSPDSQLLASGGWDRTVQLWNVQTGELLQTHKGHRGTVYGLSFSPDGKYLASCATSVFLWDLATGKLVFECADLQQWVFCTAFSPDGGTLASGGEDGKVRFWNVRTGQAAGEFPTHRGHVQCVRFSPTGKVLATAGLDSSIRLWDPATRREMHCLLRGTPGGRSTVAWTNDGKRIAGSNGLVIRIWDASTGEELLHFSASCGWIQTVAFSADNRKIVTCGTDSTLRFWDAATGRELKDSAAPHGPLFTVTFADKDKLVCGGGADTLVYCWDPRTGRDVHRFKAHQTNISLLCSSPGCRQLTAIDRSRQVSRWSIPEGRALHSPALQTSDGPEVVCAASADGRFLVSGKYGESLKLYELEAGKKPLDLDFWGKATFSADGRLLLVVSKEHSGIWEVATGREVWHFEMGAEAIALALTPKQEIFAWSDHKGTLHYYGIQHKRELRVVDNGCLVRRLDFSPDGKTLASAGEDGTVQLWEAASGERRGLLRGHQGPVFAVAFSQDCRSLVSGSKDTSALVWDLARAPLAGPDQMASLSDTGMGELWDRLASNDATKAYQAIWALAASPIHSVPFLAERVPKISIATPEQVNQWIADLDSNDFDTRKRAFGELRAHQEGAEAPLKKVVHAPSAETRTRVDELLSEIREDGASPTPDRLRVLRAIEVLERIASPEACHALAAIGKGDPQARQTKEGNASRARLATNTDRRN